MALVLQERGIGRYTWLEWVAGVPGFANLPAERIQEVVAWMLAQGMLWEEQGILGIGQKGEETYGRRHFLELLSVFLSPPLFAVLHGRQELGFVDELTFLGKQEGHRVLLLGGRAWHVTHIDWQRKVAHVEVSEDRGRTRWKGQGQGLSFRLCQAIKRVLAEDEARPWWSQRAVTQIEGGAGEVPLGDGRGNRGGWRRRRRGLVDLRRPESQCGPGPGLGQPHPHGDDRATTWPSSSSRPCRSTQCRTRSRNSGAATPARCCPTVSPEALEGMKFSDCLPPALAIHVLGTRTRDPAAVTHALGEPVRLVSS